MSIDGAVGDSRRGWQGPDPSRPIRLRGRAKLLRRQVAGRPAQHYRRRGASDRPPVRRAAQVIRASAQPHDEHFKACVTLQCQYALDTWGKFPGTVPSVWVMNFLQAQHLDLDFYDHHFRPARTWGRTATT